MLAGAEGDWLPWLALMNWLLGIAVVSVVVGAWLADRVSRRSAQDELRVESSRHKARPHPGSDFVALVRTDRSGIWRSVPMRRGMVVLALFPGLVALGGDFDWAKVAIFPGLVASGGVLLFGVNWASVISSPLPYRPAPRRRCDGSPACRQWHHATTSRLSTHSRSARRLT